MRRQVYLVLLALFLSTVAHSQDSPFSHLVTIRNVRHHHYATHTRIVVDTNRPPLYRLERSRDSRSLLIHFSSAALIETLRDKPILLLGGGGKLEKLEIKEEDTRSIVVLMTFNTPWEENTMLLANPDRLVIDITYPQNNQQASTPQVSVPSAPSVPFVPPVSPVPVPPVLVPSVPSVSRSPSISVPSLSPPTLVTPAPLDKIQTIVIDPGHGGEAPGAIGPTGLTESEVVLDVSFRVKKRIEERLRKKVLLTRDSDTAVPLHDRTKMANDQKADLFISIHANASPKRAVQGVETYLFGRATNEAALATAARENATNVQTTQDFQDVILSDLLRDFTLNESLELAHYTQESFAKTLIPQYNTKSLGVKKAPFYVLAHTNMPAILAEISFISNRIEEERLRQSSYREEIAESIFQGIRAYLEEKR